VTDTGDHAFRSVVLLDTNAVHYATLALTFSNENGVDLFAVDCPAFEKCLSSAKLGAKAAYDYRNGYFVIRYVQKLLSTSADVYFSPITALELLCGSLRGEAIKRAATGGVPNRWYSRIEEDEVRQQLEPDGYDRIAVENSGIEQQFNHAGIAIIQHQPDREVWEISRVILENIFIDVQDCLVYASAICLQASEIVTWDGYLGDIVEWTRNPGSARSGLTTRFSTLQKAVTDRCAEIMGWDADDVVLPQRQHIKGIEKLLKVETPK
jgi:hypothetical protein